MIFQRLKKVWNKIAENLFNRLIDRTDQSKLTSLLRQCVKAHPFTHALYQYRIGNTRFARELTARLRPRTGFERRFCARILEISRIVERGYEAEIPALPVPVSWNRSVLLALHYSLPYDPAGYAIRSHSILTHLQRHVPFPRNGCEVCRLAPPLKVLEAMATAKPVIVSDLPPLFEMVKDGENGFVCKADDMQSLMETIQRLYENPGERLAIGEAARNWVVENRSWENMSEKYIHLYCKICEDV
jgi:hypothetical protein